MTIQIPDEFPRLETENLFLRELLPGDANEVFNIFSDEEVTRFYDLDVFTDIGTAEELIARQKNRFEEGLGIRWGITLKPNDTVIGTVGYLFTIQSDVGGLGYDLARQYWRRGIMTEALAAVIEHGFSGYQLNRIQALVMPKNVASLNLLSKLNFKNEGILREFAYFKGRYHDLACLALLRSEYQPGISIAWISH